MTAAEIDRERKLKSFAVARLQSGLPSFLCRYGERMTVDARLGEYLRAVADDPEGHNLYEVLGVLRFMALHERYGWKPKAVRRFVTLYEKLRFSGVSGRQRYRMTPVQVFQFASIYGFVDAAGRRLVRTAYIFVPRKFSKTTSAAALAVHDLLLGDYNAQAFVGANSYEQAKICFDEIRAIMSDLDPDRKYFRVNREKIFFTGGQRDSMVRCLTANAKTQDGLFASLVILDEYSQARNTRGKNGADLKNVLTTSMGPRREPLTVIITTASEVLDGPCYHEIEGVKAVLRGEKEADTVFASLFMPDAWDAEDDPRTWAKVQPHLGITVQPDYYAKAWEDAQLSAENMLAFRTKLLNIFAVNDIRSWIEEGVCRSLMGHFDIDKVEGKPVCFVGFDLSVHDDFSAVAYVLYSERLKRFFLHVDYYLPEDTLPKHKNREIYTTWAEQGHLKLCKGKRIDVRQIGDDILRRAKNVTMLRIVYDGYKAQDLRNLLITVGGPGSHGVLQPYSQTNGSFNLPVESFEMMAYANPPKIEMNDNPINLWCLLNCVIDEDSLGNKKPMKCSQYRKIDGVIAGLMGLGALITFEH